MRPGRLLEGSASSGSEAMEQQVPSAVGKCVPIPKHLAVQIQRAKQTQTRHKSTQNVSWGSSAAAGRFRVASQQRSSLSSAMSPQRERHWRGDTLHTTTTHLCSASLALQLIAHEALFTFSLSVSSSLRGPQNVSQCSRDSFMNVTADAKSLTSSDL